MQDDTPDEWLGEVEVAKVQWQPALMELNFDATADLQDVIYEAEAGELAEGELLPNLRSAVNLLQERESELLRVVLHGNELASALNSMHSKKPQNAKLRHDISLLSLANTQLKATARSSTESLTKLVKDNAEDTLHHTPSCTTLPEAVKLVADLVEAVVTKQAFREATHRKLLTSYETSLQESGGLLLQGARGRRSTGTASVGQQTDLGAERQVQIDILNARCAELEQMLTASQEQNLDDASAMEALSAEVVALKAGREEKAAQEGGLKGHRAELERMLSEAQALNTMDTDVVAELQAEVSVLQDVRDADRSTIKRLTEQMHALRDAAKNAANNSNTQSLVQEMGVLKEQRTELERMLMETQEQSIADATEIADLQDEIGSLRARDSSIPLPQSELEKKLVTAQEQNLIDASMIETLKEQVARLQSEKEPAYSTDKSDAVSEELERSMGHDERAEVAEGHNAVLQADNVGLREKMVTMNAACKTLGDTVGKLWTAEAHLRTEVVHYILEKAACGDGTKSEALLSKLESMLTQWEQDAEQRAAMVVTSQGVMELPSVSVYRDMLTSWKATYTPKDGDTGDFGKLQEEVSELKYALNGVIDEKQELEAELLEARCQLDTLRCDGQQGGDPGSAASSLIASTASSKWTPARAPAQPPLEIPLPPAIFGNMVMGGASPLNLQMAPSPMSTAPSSPEMNLRWASPRARPMIGRRGDAHQRLPMGAFVLPPAPDKHRFVKKPGPQTPTHMRTREDDLIDALSIPQTDSFVLDTNMSPSDTSESFSPPMSPAGRRAVLRMLAGTSPSAALPLSPLHCHRVPVIMRISKGVQTDGSAEARSSPTSLTSPTSDQSGPLPFKDRDREDDDLQYSGDDSDL